MEILFKRFNSTSENNFIAFLDSNINSDYFYTRWFEQAGYLLYETWVGKEEKEEDNISIDCIVYSIYVCYRQALELKYKKLIRTYEGSVESGHKIKGLHGRLMDTPNLSDSLKKYLLNNQEFIEYIDEIDPQFDRFRYDTTRKGEKQNHKTELDLMGMSDGFINTCRVLDDVWGNFSMN